MEKAQLIQLVIQAQAGNMEAISGLFDCYKDDVYSIALRETGNRTLAEDIVQESFLEVMQAIQHLREPEAFGSWLKQIAYHQCSRHFKRKETRHEVQAEETEDHLTVFDTLEERNAAYIPDEALDQKEFRAVILTMIGELPEVQSSALRMFYFDELSLKAIAEVQGVSLNTANTRLNRGRKAMKGAVERYEKKHNIRLHTIAFFPFFRWLLADTAQTLPAEAAAKITQILSAEAAAHADTGLAAAAAAETAGAGAASTATASAATVAGSATTATATTAAGLGAKLLAMPVAAKIVAGVLAAAVTLGGVSVAAGNGNGKTNTVPTGQAVVETVISSHSETDALGEETIGMETTETIPTSSPDESLPLVSDAYYKHIPQTAYNGEGFYHIPKVNTNLPQIEETNLYIYNELYKFLQGEVLDIINHGDYPSLCRIAYSWGVKNQYLSVLVGLMYGESYNGVYTISVETGALINAREILGAYNLTWEEFRSIAHQKCASMDWTYEYIQKEFPDPIPYINAGNADLCAICPGASTEGSDVLINITGTDDPVHPCGYPESASNPEILPSNESAVFLSEIYTQYESFLTSGKTETGFVPAYYAYIDIDQDGIPELLVANSDGTPASWTTCEMYTYRAGKLIYCGYADARYTYFYHVNSQYLLGTNRLGSWYVSPDDTFRTVHHTTIEISYNDGTRKDISEAEFDYYNAYKVSQDGQITPGGFVESAKIISLQRNTYLSENIIENTLDLSKAWASFGERSCKLDMLSIGFREDGTYHYIIGRQHSGLFYGYSGIYIVDGNEISFWERSSAGNYGMTYQFDPESLQLTQISERGFFPDSYVGEVFQLEEDPDNDADRIKSLSAIDWSHDP